MSRFMHEVLETSLTHLRTGLEHPCAIFHHEECDFGTVTWAEDRRRFFVSADSKEAAGA